MLIGKENYTQAPVSFLNIAELDQNVSHIDDLEQVTKANDLAYCIYTSGTTGKPKGVLVEHIRVLNLRKYFTESQYVTTKDKALQFASFAFDAAVSELAMSLLIGECFYMMPKEIQQIPYLFEKYMKDNEISIAILPPQFLNQVDVSNLRTIITAGSATNSTIVQQNKGVQIYSND